MSLRTGPRPMRCRAEPAPYLPVVSLVSARIVKEATLGVDGEDRGITSLIKTRARQSAEDPPETLDEAAIRERQDRERRRLQGNAAAWRAYFFRLARSHDRRAREYEAKADALKEASP